MNPRLRLAIAEGKASEMPNDNIDYAIKRGTGELEGVTYEPGSYDAFGPAGVALLITVLTDNKTRTVADVRNILRKGGGSMGGAGSVTWMFEQKGVIVIPKEDVDGDELFMTAVDAGAEDVVDADDSWEIRTDIRSFQAVYDAVGAAGYTAERAELTMIPTNTVQVADGDAPKVLRLLEQLSDNDDVQKVYANFEISDAALEAYGE
jgi:YebC/PmpR family DNA-binding regulatory protein